MKIFSLVAAATLIAVAAPIAAPAIAQPGYHGPHKVIVKKRKVCTVKWVHHRKVRRCFWR